MQWQFLLFINSLHPNTSEVYKMNTFSLNSVLEKTFMKFRPLKMHFTAVSAQDRFCFLNEREVRMS